jgi:ribosomal protein S18 acetylase RimI-like enzyme
MTNYNGSLFGTPEVDVHLVQASQFTIDELTNSYNQTRVDYLVPMPMNAARLASYIRNYDVDLDRSWVAIDGNEILGLAMLGVRSGRTWVTRLGVLPVRRRHGVGEALVRTLLNETRTLNRPAALLEVIKGNHAAHQLFLKTGFEETRELLVMRRPPGPPQTAPLGQANWLEKDEALDLLSSHSTRLAWTNEIESFLNAGDAQSLEVRIGSEHRAWMVFRKQKFLLSHFIIHTQSGEPAIVGPALIAHLYQRFPQMDTYIENLPAQDTHLSALLENGFIEVFRRIEMECKNPFAGRIVV